MRAVFADCHVGRRPDDDGPFLAGLEEAARRGAKSISLLGDIFHFFIAHPKFETPAIHRFLRKVEELRGRGVPVTYVEGNRDFFLRGSYVEKQFREVTDGLTHVRPGSRVMAVTQLLQQNGVAYRWDGENIFWAGGPPFDDAVASAEAWWMASPEHRDNILGPHFRQVGIGTAIDGDKIYVAAVFTD